MKSIYIKLCVRLCVFQYNFFLSPLWGVEWSGGPWNGDAKELCQPLHPIWCPSHPSLQYLPHHPQCLFNHMATSEVLIGLGYIQKEI